jgi:hypothetical protein
MRIIEGSPQEIVEYERLAGVVAETRSNEDNAASPDEEQRRPVRRRHPRPRARVPDSAGHLS